MTIHEIRKEVLTDIANLSAKLEQCRNDFKKMVLRARHYPVSKSYDCRTKEKRNLFIAGFSAVKRKHWKNPILFIYAIYDRPDGKYAVCPSPTEDHISIYPPHFFERYQERILKDASLSPEQIIRQFFSHHWGLMGAVVDENFQTMYHDFEKADIDDKVSFVAATAQGYCFGLRQKGVSIIKTIISEEMVFEDQKPLFKRLRDAFVEDHKDTFGIDL